MLYLKVGTPLSALIPAPERTTMFLAFARTSRNAFMSLDGPLDSEAITVYVIKTSASTWKWSSTTLKPERVVNETSAWMKTRSRVDAHHPLNHRVIVNIIRVLS